MKLTIELDADGKLRLDSDEEQIDVAAANFMLDLAKSYLVALWLEKTNEAAEYDIEEDDEDI